MPTADLLPPNATELERTLVSASERIERLPAALRDLWSADRCPPGVLPWLAWAWGADEWDGTWPIDQQRAVVASAIDVRRRHGTIGAVREAIAALGIECQVQEWFAQIPAGTPYTFSLLLEAGQAGYSLATLERLRRIVDNTRNLRSHLDLIAPVATSRATLHVSAAAAVGSDMAVQFAGYNLISDGAHISDGAYISNGLILS